MALIWCWVSVASQKEIIQVPSPYVSTSWCQSISIKRRICKRKKRKKKRKRTNKKGKGVSYSHLSYNKHKTDCFLFDSSELNLVGLNEFAPMRKHKGCLQLLSWQLNIDYLELRMNRRQECEVKHWTGV